jgi:hypothetical protein
VTSGPGRKLRAVGTTLPPNSGEDPAPTGRVIPLHPPTGTRGFADGQPVRVRRADGTWRHGVVDLTAYGLGVGPVGRPPTSTYIPVAFDVELVDEDDIEPA